MGGFIWGLGTDQDIPGGFDEEGRAVRNYVERLSDAEMLAIRGGGKNTFIRVGRWMSETEYKKILNTNSLQEGTGGLTHLATSGADSFKSQAKKGSIYVEFDVLSTNLLQGGKSDWLFGVGNSAGNAIKTKLSRQGGSTNPKVFNVSEIIETKN